MKELSIEEKAKRYDEAIEKGKQIQNTPYTAHWDIMKEVVEHLFPELKDSGDERIRKALIKLVKKTGEGYENVIDGVSIENAISWLEAQGEQKPADKVEPKFKIEEGKWYVCTQTFVLRGEIVVIKGSTYQAREDNAIYGEDECLFIDKHDGKASEYFRLWTIQDAKDGDVLADDDLPFIFKKIDANNYSYAYCGISVDDGFKIESDVESGEWTWMQDIKPATKEQCNLLFQKMREAGYVWDDEHKQLKKIEQKPAWSEEDEIHIRSITSTIECCKAEYPNAQAVVEAYNADIDWLKSLKDKVGREVNCTTTKEWSEEDKINYNYSLTACIYYGETNGYTDTETHQKTIDWLKSLRPKNTWKPSLSQLNALGVVAKGNAPDDIEEINSLYNDLKKL